MDTRWVRAMALAALIGLPLALLSCEEESSGASADQEGAAAEPSEDSRPQQPLADWPEMIPGEDSTLSTGIVGSLLNRAPPGLILSDALIQPGETAQIAVKLGRGFGSATFKTYGGHTVIIRDVQGEEVHRQRTDQDGRMTFERRFEHPGNYFYRAFVEGKVDDKEVAPALFGVYARRQDVPLAICDLDKTLVKSSFAKVMVGVAEPFEHAAEVVSRLASEKGMTVIYLTHRPDFFAPSSKHWLRKHRFPPGPLYTSDLPGLLSGSGTFKSGEIARLKQRFPDVRLAVGDKYSDTAAYVQNDIRSVLIPDIDWSEDDDDYWRKQLAQLSSLDSEVAVCRDWFEIEEAVFGDKRFPPSRMVDRVREMVGLMRRRP